MTAFLRSVAEGLLDALFPPACAACGELGREPFCRLCAEAVDPAPDVDLDGLDEVRAAFVYGGPVALAVQRLKYERHVELARCLGLCMAAVAPMGCDVLVPVPLPRSRLIERGFNQARELARALPLPARPRALIRLEGTREQVGLHRALRLSNLKGACVPGPQGVEGLRVLIIDDVVTTGATARACAEALRRAGARRVSVLALACTPA